MANQFAPKHGAAAGEKTRTYKIWTSMVARCHSKSGKSNPQYGGAGVIVCDKWREFKNFLADMGEASAGMSIDRYPNRDGNYEPGNCRWATRQEQSENRRNVVWIEFNGQRLTPVGWARLLELDAGTIRYRLKRNWSVRQVLGVDPPPAMATYARTREHRAAMSALATTRLARKKSDRGGRDE